MKKMFIAIIILLLIIIFLLLYCNCRRKCDDCGGNQNPADSCKVFCYDYSGKNLEGMIDFNTLKQMSRDYATDPGKSLINGTSDPDALSMVFDLEKIKVLVWQMEHNVCSNHCDERKLGIRYYYIKYPESVGTADAPPSLSGIDASEKNKHALVMVPVWFDEAEKTWHDYNVWSDPPSCFTGFPPKNHHDSLFVGVTGINGDGGDNHGGIGPPPAPGFFPGN